MSVETNAKFSMHQDEGLRLANLPHCGKVVSTKVGCGRFDGKCSRAVPALVLKGLYDSTKAYSRPRPHKTSKHQ
jgi:hypothetical protein